MSIVYYNPDTETRLAFNEFGLRGSLVNFTNDKGVANFLNYYKKEECVVYIPERKLMGENKGYLLNKDTLKKVLISRNDKIKVTINDKYNLYFKEKDYKKIVDFFEKLDVTEKDNSFVNYSPKKDISKGKIVLAFFGVFFLIGIIRSLTYNPSPLEKLFEENGLGAIENVVEEPWNTNGKVLTFEATKEGSVNLEYRAYIEEDGTPYQIFVGKGKAFPIYDKSNNDTVIDERERQILGRILGFKSRSSKTFSGLTPTIKEDLVSQLNFPDTFSCKDVRYFDMGTYYILNITFTSKNAFGMEFKNVAKYKMDFEDNTFTLIEIL